MAPHVYSKSKIRKNPECVRYRQRSAQRAMERKILPTNLRQKGPHKEIRNGTRGKGHCRSDTLHQLSGSELDMWPADEV